MHWHKAVKVHVPKGKVDPAAVACLAVYNELLDLSEQIEKGEDGEDIPVAPFDFYHVIGALDIETGLFTYDTQADYRQIAPWYNTLAKVAKQFNVTQRLLKSSFLERDPEWSDAGIRVYNTDTKHPVTHIVIVDFHI